jgi:hypothetical protein
MDSQIQTNTIASCTIDGKPQRLPETVWYQIMDIVQEYGYQAVLECISCYAGCSMGFPGDDEEDVAIRKGLKKLLEAVYHESQSDREL